MSETTIQQIPVGDIAPSPRNRKVVCDQELESLAQSIRLKGVLQPILLRPIDKPAKGGPAFEIIAGERRWKASVLAERPTVPAIVRGGLTADEAFELTLIENLQRQDLTPLEEAESFQQILQLPGASVSSVAARIGRSIQYVYDRAKLLNLVEEAQELLRSGSITAGHAILLARLGPKDQAAAIKSGLFTNEQRLAMTEEEHEQLAEARKSNPYAGLKAFTVRELQGWIDKHIRVDFAEVEPDPMLFPEAAETLGAARQEEEKVVSITYEYSSSHVAKSGELIFGPMSWKRADSRQGSKPCLHSVVGVIVIGAGRGEAFRVCTAKKKCDIHWGSEKRAAARRAKERATSGSSGADRHAEERAKREAERRKEEAARARFEKARTAILAATAGKVKAANATGRGPLAALLVKQVLEYGQSTAAAEKLVPVGKTAEDLVRHLAFIALEAATRGWQSETTFPKLVKALGVDVSKILDDVAPEKPTSNPVEKQAAPAKKATGKKSKKKAAA